MIELGTRKPIIIGTEIYSRTNNRKNEFAEVLKAGVSNNILGLDTAMSYGGGGIEKLIGEFSDYIDKDFLICTKFGNSQFESNSFDLSSVKAQLKTSVSNLNRSSIDIYYFHSGSNENFLQDELWEFLQFQKNIGVVKNLGLSLMHDLVKVDDLIQITNASRYGISVLQTVLNPLHQHSLKSVLGIARESGMFVVGRMPLSKGLIPKISLNELEQLIKVDGFVKESIVKYWADHNLLEVNLSSAIKIGLTLKWCLRYVDSVVMAHSNKSQMLMNLNVLDAITSQDMKYTD